MMKTQVNTGGFNVEADLRATGKMFQRVEAKK